MEGREREGEATQRVARKMVKANAHTLLRANAAVRVGTTAVEEGAMGR